VVSSTKVRENLAGEWQRGLREPLGLFTTLEPELALEVYRQRMKVEESFRELEGLLGLGSGINKRQENEDSGPPALGLQCRAADGREVA
jgi:hypothetical protein